MCPSGSAIVVCLRAHASSSPAAAPRTTRPLRAVAPRRRSRSFSGTRRCRRPHRDLARRRDRAHPRGGAQVRGRDVVITGAAESALAKAVDHVVVATPAIEESYCHTASYTAAIAAGRALQADDVSGLAAQVFRELDAEPIETSSTIASSSPAQGAMRRLCSRPCSSSAKVRTSPPRPTTQSSSYTVPPPAIDHCGALLRLEEEARAAHRALNAMRALGELGCDALLLPTAHPVVDVVPFQQLASDLAETPGHRSGHDPLGPGPVGSPRKAQDFTAGPSAGRRSGAPATARRLERLFSSAIHKLIRAGLHHYLLRSQ